MGLLDPPSLHTGLVKLPFAATKEAHLDNLPLLVETNVAHRMCTHWMMRDYRLYLKRGR